jgi:hypothetical protein
MGKPRYVDSRTCVERIQSLQKRWIPSLAIVALFFGLLALFTESRPALVVAMLAAALVMIISLALLRLLWKARDGKDMARTGLGVVAVSAVALLALVIFVIVDWVVDKEDHRDFHTILLGIAVLFPMYLWINIKALYREGGREEILVA